MKKLYNLFLIVLLALPLVSSAQLNNDPAPDWTLDDLDGNTHHLHSILASGRGVALEFSATWCGPCWNYHNTGIMEDLWDNYGPNGTDEIMVFYIEASASTNEACLYGPSGCSGGTQGNWVAGHDFPFIHLEGADLGVANDYGVPSYPAFYVVSPDMRAWYIGFNPSPAEWESWLLESFSLDVVGTVTAAGCEEGAIDLDVSGGHGNISFNWSNGESSQNITNLQPGDYTVTVSDANGYDKVQTFSVTGPPNGPIVINTVAQIDVDCAGASSGELEVSATGGFSNFTYEWDNGETTEYISGLAYGSYEVTVTDQMGCTETQSYFVDEPLPLESDGTVTDESCDQGNGAVDADADGGVFPYEYTLNGNSNGNGEFSDLAAGTYDVVIEDANGCFENYTFTVENTPAPVAMAAAANMVTCASPQVTVSGMGSATGPNISYQWTTSNGNIVSGATSLDVVVDAAGDYMLEVMDNVGGCSSMTMAAVSEDVSTPTITVSDNTELTCATTSVQICATVAAGHSVEWQLSGGNSNETCITVDAADTYTAIVTAPNGCTNSANVEVGVSNDLPQVTVDNPSTITCMEQTATLNASVTGDPADFTFAWTTSDGNIQSGDNSATPTVNQGGTYTVAVTETATGCQTMQNVTVTSTAELPEASFSYTLENGTLTLTNTSSVTDGASWDLGNGSNSSDNTVTTTYSENGTYNVCITVSNDCGPSTECIEIPYAVALAFDAATMDYACHNDNNGSINLMPSGGDGDYSVEWAGPNGFSSNELMISGLEEGNYAFTLSDEFGYSVTGLYEIKNAPELLINDAAKLDVTCFGAANGMAGVDASGGTGDLSYAWTTGANTASISDLAPGTYGVVVSDANGCSMTETFNIVEPTDITYDGAVTDASNGEANGAIDMTAMGGTGDLSYSWSNGETTASIADLLPGDYTCDITDENTCTKTTETFTVGNMTAVNDLEALTQLELFPNPAHNALNVAATFDNTTSFRINIVSLDGQLKFSQNYNTAELATALDISTLAGGLYLLQIANEDGVSTRKFIKLAK